MIEALKITTSILGLCITTAGIYFVTKQLELNRSAIKIQTRASLYHLSHLTYKLFVDNPQLRPYFYSNKPLPDCSEPDAHSLAHEHRCNRDQVLAAAEMLIDYFEHILHSESFIESDLFTSWVSYFQELYSKSDALKAYVEENHKLCSDKLLDFLKFDPHLSKRNVVAA